MTQVPRTITIDAGPDVRGMLGSRVAAFLVDVLVMGVLWLIFAAVLTVFGLLTFGLSWLLIPPLWIIVAILYNGITVSGRHRGTWGMRMFGVEIRTTSGQTAPFVVAAVHPLFFYISVSALTPLVLLVGVFRDDRRMLHDLVAGLVAVRRGS